MKDENEKLKKENFLFNEKEKKTKIEFFGELEKKDQMISALSEKFDLLTRCLGNVVSMKVVSTMFRMLGSCMFISFIKR